MEITQLSLIKSLNKIKTIGNANDTLRTTLMHELKSERKTTNLNQKLNNYFNFTENKKILERLERMDHSASNRHIREIENLVPKTYDNDHIMKICQLLKKKDKNYSYKRKNINKVTYNFDENNNLYLTLPKFDYGKRIREMINEKKLLEEKLAREMNMNQYTNEDDELDEDRNRLAELIPEFYENNDSRTDESVIDDYKVYSEDDSDSNYERINEDDQKKMYELLTTAKEKFTINKNGSNSDILSRIENSTKENIVKNSFNFKLNSDSSLKNISKINSKNNSSQSILWKSSPKGSKKTSVMENDPLIKNIRKLREKMNIVKKVSNKNKKKKVHITDIFHYDKNKWEKKKTKESDNILLRVKEIEQSRKDWNEKHIPDLNLPIIPYPDLSKLKSMRKMSSFNYSKELRFADDVSDFSKNKNTENSPFRKVKPLPKLSKQMKKSFTKI